MVLLRNAFYFSSCSWLQYFAFCPQSICGQVEQSLAAWVAILYAVGERTADFVLPRWKIRLLLRNSSLLSARLPPPPPPFFMYFVYSPYLYGHLPLSSVRQENIHSPAFRWGYILSPSDGPIRFLAVILHASLWKYAQWLVTHALLLFRKVQEHSHAPWIPANIGHIIESAANRQHILYCTQNIFGPYFCCPGCEKARLLPRH